MKLITYCADVGSTKSENFGWARVTGTPGQFEARTGTSIDRLIDSMAADLELGAVSLGIEAPLYIPVPRDANNLSCGRPGEGSRSCFAPAGGYVTTLATHQSAYLLRELNDRSTELDVTVNLEHWQRSPTNLFIWEAFVSQNAHTKSDSHTDDAITAATVFHRQYREAGCQMDDALPINPDSEDDRISLIGAAIIWAGIHTDLKLLKAPTLCVRPTRPFKPAAVSTVTM